MSTCFPAMIVIARPFGMYKKGDLISDPAAIKAILGGGNAGRIVIPTLPIVPADHEQELR